jgi:hypothetical protein
MSASLASGERQQRAATRPGLVTGRTSIRLGIGLFVTLLVLTAPTTLAQRTVVQASDLSIAYNANGTVEFPTAQYGNATVPQYLNITWATVQERQGVLYFRVHANATIPAQPSLAFGANHVGVTFGIQTNRSTAGSFRFVGHAEAYLANVLVGMIYTSVGDALHIGHGWRGFVSMNGLNFTRIPASWNGSIYSFQLSSAALGHPESFRWVAVAECDPVPNSHETYRTTLLVDYVPNFGYATWSRAA